MLTRRLVTINKGFTMGEVVLSAFMLSFGMTTVIALIGSSFRMTVNTQNIVLASQLAQEGIELSRNIRDNDLVDKEALGAPADVFTNFPNGANSNCIIDYTMNALDCSPANYGLGISSGFYRHGVPGGLFYRVVKINHTGGSDQALVKSFVTWQDPAGNLNGGGASSWCTLENKCVYAEVLLIAWE